MGLRPPVAECPFPGNRCPGLLATGTRRAPAVPTTCDSSALVRSPPAQASARQRDTRRSIENAPRLGHSGGNFPSHFAGSTGEGFHHHQPRKPVPGLPGMDGGRAERRRRLRGSHRRRRSPPLDLSDGRAGVRRGRGGAVLVGAHARRDPDRRRGARITTAGTLTRWYDLGHWSERDRTSVTGQGDQDGRVDTDTLIAAGDGWTSVQLRITLLRPPGSVETPVLLRAGLLMSRSAAGPSGTEPPGPGCGVVLDVPAYAQFRHADHGGRGWCSPASIAMVLDFWGVGPGPDELAEWPAGHPDPQVDHAAARVHDPAYGYGNWSFNVAHAARRGLIAFVTRLRSLAEAEQFITAGVPLILSSNGHVVVLAGFTGDGAPILHDPAANTNAGVRCRGAAGRRPVRIRACLAVDQPGPLLRAASTDRDPPAPAGRADQLVSPLSFARSYSWWPRKPPRRWPSVLGSGRGRDGGG